MKIQEKNVFLVKAWVFASLGLNGLISCIVEFFYTNDTHLLIIGFVLFLLLISVPVLHAQLSILKKDLGAISTILECLGIFALSVGMVYILYQKVNLMWALILVGMILFEGIVLLVIIHRYRIFRFFKKLLQPKSKK